MAPKAPAATRAARPGRPPAGRNGERSSEYRPITIRIPADARRRLDALRIALGRPAWTVIADALDVYAGQLAGERPELRPLLAAVKPAKRRPAPR